MKEVKSYLLKKQKLVEKQKKILDEEEDNILNLLAAIITIGERNLQKEQERSLSLDQIFKGPNFNKKINITSYLKDKK